MNFEYLKNIYQNKTIFLTGHTGFKGTWLLTLFHLLGAKVIGYSLPAETKSIFNDIQANTLCQKHIEGDIRDIEKLSLAIETSQPNFIFHLAAQALVLDSYEDPLTTYQTNVIGTANLLEVTKKLQKPCVIVVITTDKVYQNMEWIHPYREHDPLGGYDPYSASKACAEIVTSSYRNSFFHPKEYSKHQKSIATARAGNVIGGGDWSKNRIIPDIVRALLKGEEIIVRNPLAIRPWQHVLEALYGYLMLGAKMSEDPSLPKWCDAWNFGPLYDEGVHVKQVVEYAIESWGKGTYTTPTQQNVPHEANLLRLDCSKAVHYLGWKPKMNAKEAIKFTIEWYKNFSLNPKNVLKITLDQTRNYFL
jgi:CDP-glucose 4,6-dehydratase